MNENLKNLYQVLFIASYIKIATYLFKCGGCILSYLFHESWNTFLEGKILLSFSQRENILKDTKGITCHCSSWAAPSSSWHWHPAALPNASLMDHSHPCCWDESRVFFTSRPGATHCWWVQVELERAEMLWGLWDISRCVCTEFLGGLMSWF